MSKGALVGPGLCDGGQFVAPLELVHVCGRRLAPALGLLALGDLPPKLVVLVHDGLLLGLKETFEIYNSWLCA